MATEVASAFVSLIPSAKGFGAGINREIAGDIGSSGSKAGKMFGGTFAKASVGPIRSVVGVVKGPLLGAFAAVAGVSVLKGFISDARESAQIGRMTVAVVKSTGRAAHITADQVGDLATAISNKTGADDEAVQSGANLLLTFTKVRNEVGKGNDIFSQATQAAVDMSAALGGDMKSSALQLGKALNDPIKGISALTRSGVSFTEQQKDQVKALVGSGKTLQAQKLILAEVNKEFSGAAAAANDPLARLQVILGNVAESIGGFFLPAVDKVASFIGDKAIPAVEDLTDRVKTLLGPVSAGASDFWAGFTLEDPDSIGVPLEGLVDVGQRARKALLRIRGAVTDALGALSGFGQKVKKGIGSVDVSALFSGISTGGVGAVADLFNGMVAKVAGLDWGSIGKTIGGLIGDGVGAAAGGALKLTAGLGSLIAGVNWGELAIAFGKQAPTLVLGFLTGLLNFDVTGFMSFAVHHWFEILIGIITLVFSAAKLAPLLAKIPLVGPLLAWLLRAFESAARPVLEAVGRFIGSIAGAFGRGFASAFPGIASRLVRFLGLIPTAIGVAALRAVEAASRLMGRLAGAILAGAERLGAAAGGLVNRLLSALVGGIGRIAGPVASAVGRMIVRFAGAITRGGGRVLRAAASLPGKILDGIGDLSGLLFNKGKELIGGLISGIGEGAKNIGGAMGDVAGKIGGFFHGSPVKEGPLKIFNSSTRNPGVQLVNSYAKGMLSNLGTLDVAAGAMASRAAVTSQATLTGRGVAVRRAMAVVGGDGASVGAAPTIGNLTVYANQLTRNEAIDEVSRKTVHAVRRGR